MGGVADHDMQQEGGGDNDSHLSQVGHHTAQGAHGSSSLPDGRLLVEVNGEF